LKTTFDIRLPRDFRSTELAPVEGVAKSSSVISNLFNETRYTVGLTWTVLFTPVFGVMMAKNWFAFKRANAEIRKFAENLSGTLEESNSRQLMVIHTQVAELYKALTIRQREKGQRKQSKYVAFVSGPVERQIEYSLVLIRDILDRLRKFLYPHLHEQLSDEQIAELKKLSSNWEDIWEDDDYVMVEK